MLTEKQLMHLATAMSEQDGTGSTRRIDAGYTYFGQFISHEIVAATLHPGDPSPTRIASPLLDLDSVYGMPEQMETWLPGGFFATPAPPSLPDDLLRNSGGVAHIPEPRNDDNVILAQLHRFWQRFHNFLLQQGLAANPVQAREFVTKVVQLLVVEDFLRQVLEPRVFASYFRSNERWLTFDTTESRRTSRTPASASGIPWCVPRMSRSRAAASATCKTCCARASSSPKT